MSGAGAGIQAARILQRQEEARQARQDRTRNRIRDRRRHPATIIQSRAVPCATCQESTLHTDLMYTEEGEVCHSCLDASIDSSRKFPWRLILIPPLKALIPLIAFSALVQAPSSTVTASSQSFLPVLSALLLVVVLLMAIIHGAAQGLQSIQAARRSLLMPPGTDLPPQQARLVSMAGRLTLSISVVSMVLAGFVLFG